MELLKVCYTSLFSIVLLFLLTKLMGHRQLSQLSLFDYINGITIGSIASEMAIAPDEYKKPLVAMIVYALAATLISVITCKSVKLRRFITGKPLLLFENGKVYEKNLFKAKLDVSEFLTQCRNSGYFDLNHIHTAILEANGKISFLPMVAQRPATPADMNLSPAQEYLAANVILDGVIMKENLQATGNNEAWLQSQLLAQGVESPSEVFLATCDPNNTLSVYRKTNKKINKDIFS